jgi:hypothetical protein
MLDSDAEDLSQKNICFHCVQEIYLCDKIRKERKIQKCSYCGCRRSCYSIGEMADIIEGAFEQYYVRTSDQPNSWEYPLLADQESNYHWERKGERVVYAIMNAADIPEAAAHDIQEILECRHADIESERMGEETEFASGSYYEEKGVDVSYWEEEWRNFERSLTTEARFFSQTAANHLAAIFEGIQEMRTIDEAPLVVDAGPNTALSAFYRARVFQSDRMLEEALEPARPPSGIAAASACRGRADERPWHLGILRRQFSRSSARRGASPCGQSGRDCSIRGY